MEQKLRELVSLRCFVYTRNGGATSMSPASQTDKTAFRDASDCNAGYVNGEVKQNLESNELMRIKLPPEDDYNKSSDLHIAAT